MSAVAFLVLAVVALADETATSHVLMPLKVREIPGHFHGFQQYFTKYIPILSPASHGSHGIQVVATEQVPDEKVERVANVLAELLDNDEDGWLDNHHVVDEMAKRGATMIMFGDQHELEDSGFDGVPGFDLQDVEGDETAGNRSLHAHLMTSDLLGHEFACMHRPGIICDAALEEVFHLVTQFGFAHAYPKQFSERAGSALAVAMDELIGSCGYASVHNPLHNHSSFRFPNCTGVYHYEDHTCHYACLVTEYFHHFCASYNGEYPWKAPSKREGICTTHHERAAEWELCAAAPDGSSLEHSRQVLREGDPDGFALITDPLYKVPLDMPDGNYMPKHNHSLQTASEQSQLHMPAAMTLSDFSTITLQGRARRAHRTSLMDKKPLVHHPINKHSHSYGSIYEIKDDGSGALLHTPQQRSKVIRRET